MSYIKQNFTDGQVLNAEHLNKMEQGIEGVSNIIVSEGGDTLTWDGNTEGLDVEPASGMYWRISGAAPTISDFSNGCRVVAGSDVFDIPASDVSAINEEVIFATFDGEPFVCVASVDNAVFGGMNFPHKGIYAVKAGELFVSSLTIPGYTGFATEKIDPKYLPEHLPWAEEPVTTTEVILEEASYTFADGMCQVAANVNLVDGAECIVTWDGVEYVSVCKEYIEDSQSLFAFGNPAIV